MFLHSDRFLLQTVRVFFLIFQIVLKVFLFPIWSVLPSFSTSETSVLNLEKFVYEARIDGYDENGVIYQRLNKTDHEELEKKLNLLADYFSTFEIVDGIKCNGTLCKGEIGADLFGLNAVINLAKTNKSFDYELFFLTLAEEYYYVTSEQIMVINNDRDTHPPHYLRVNAIIQQFDEFYETYNIKWWNGMYLSHKKRMRF